MLLNVIICDIGPSCLPRSDVTLLKNNEGESVSNKRHYCQLLKLFSKGKISYNSLMYLLIYVTSASTVDHSALLT